MTDTASAPISRTFSVPVPPPIAAAPAGATPTKTVTTTRTDQTNGDVFTVVETTFEHAAQGIEKAVAGELASFETKAKTFEASVSFDVANHRGVFALGIALGVAASVILKHLGLGLF